MNIFLLLYSFTMTCGSADVPVNSPTTPPLEKKCIQEAFAKASQAETITKAYRALHLQNPNEALRLVTNSTDVVGKKRIELLAFAALHNEEKLIAAIKEAKAANLVFDDLLLEHIAWHIIKTAHNNSAPEVRAATLAAAAVAQDAQSVQILLHALSDPQIPIQMMALHFAGSFHDDEIKETICDILTREPSPEIVEGALSALISMKAYEVAGKLRILSEKAKTSEIKRKLLFTSIELQEKISRDAIDSLLKSPKQSDHMLALSAVLQKNPEDIDALIPLLTDSSEEVLCATLVSLAIIRPHLEKDKIALIETLMLKSSSKVRLSAAFSLLCMDEDVAAVRNGSGFENLTEEKQSFLSAQICQSQTPFRSGDNVPGEHMLAAASFLENQLQSENPVTRLYAAALISRSGTKGLRVAANTLSITQDPFVQLNLAAYLIRERHALDIAQKALLEGLKTKEKMIKQQDFAFSYICKSNSLRTPAIPRYPETVDLMERLDLIRILATVDRKIALDKTKEILHDTGWGIAFTASVLLLQEGDASSYEFIRPLLHDEDNTIQIQAAIVLAAFMQDEEAREVLEKAFSTAPQTMKEQILYSIAVIGDRKSIPFLTDLLIAPSLKIRTEAASAIISCLNH